jgi:hypothetical protein
VTGVPVLAVDTCWVWRIRLWNGGYGKALYVQLPDGKIAVYGHLSRFLPEIDRMVEQEQDLKGSYEVELYFEPGVFRFLPGDTLAFSGETGSGPPHLHFELRSGRYDHFKVNPVPDYIDMPESYAPEIGSVMIEPLALDCSINGRYERTVVTRARRADTLRIGGEFGLSVAATDQAQCGREVRPIRYDAWIDDRHVWRLNLDTFPFAKSHFVGVFYQIVDGKSYIRLHDPYGLDLSGFDCLGGHGTGFPADLAPGYHVITVAVADAWGNTDSLSVPFLYGRMPDFDRFHLQPDSAGILVTVVARDDCSIDLNYRLPQGQWLDLEAVGDPEMWVARIPGAAPGTEVVCTLVGEYGFARACTLGVESGRGFPVVETVFHRDYIDIYVRPDNLPRILPGLWVLEDSRDGAPPLNAVGVFEPVGSRSYRSIHYPRSSRGSITVDATFIYDNGARKYCDQFAFGRLTAGAELWFEGDAHRIRLTAPAGFSTATLIRVSDEGPDRDTTTTYAGFERISGRVVMEPQGAFFNERVEVLIEPQDLALEPGMAVYAERSRPVFLGRFDSTGTSTVKLRNLENLVILEDLVPPEVHVVGRLRRRSEDGKAIFHARVADSGSGLDIGSLRAFVDDDTAIVSYDPDTGRVEGRSRKPLQSGTHRITLEAQDRVGNLTTETVEDLRIR